MLEIGRTIISDDLIISNFSCDLNSCKGACCVSGDSGAPLETNEAETLNEILPLIKEYLSNESLKTIEEQGVSVVDIENDIVTPLNNGKECAYVIFEKGIAFCAIEKAYNEGKISFQKPLSCHLYPVRIKKYQKFDAVNYARWEICNPAIVKGNKLNMPVYLFTRVALERKYGVNWFRHLISDAKNLSFEGQPGE